MAANPPSVIIGWGLAGATLAWQLHFRNREFSVYDNGMNHCSRAAAGIANPIVFKRLTKSWNADILMPYAEDFYTRIGEILGFPLLSYKDIYPVFSSIEEENNWSSKEGDERFRKFISSVDEPAVDNVSMPFGLGRVRTFGNIDPVLFLDASRDFFQKKGIRFENRDFDADEAIAMNDRQVIFCEGVGAMTNPLFCRLPFRPTHGEVLTIETDELDFDGILNKNMFVLPLGNNRFKIGSTYRWNITEPMTTELGKAEILEKFENFIDCKYRIVSHAAGVRPTVAGRRPFIGSHPQFKHIHIFNGLGTKGVMIAPYYAAQFLDYMFDGGALDPEVDVMRFKTLLAAE